MTRRHLIPTRRALIGWSYARNGRHVGKVVVIEQDLTKPSDYLGPPEWQEAMFTAGACDRAWLNGEPGQTPAGVFADILSGEGFANPFWLAMACLEFGKISNCGWARTMAQAMPAAGLDGS